MKLYIYSKCSTCKAALQFLKQNEIEFTQEEITEKTPTKEELEQMLSFFEGDLRKLFNTSGLLYKELQLSKKLPTLTKDQALDLLKNNGMLIKRPFLIGKTIGTVGFDVNRWKELLLNG